ncbi:hypothetical protein L6164_035916 [Bauhinia variegata]|uniref:Uncharacterized protein n=1 Tax=Bauhinia variegata TaxID=167791 RepID=A0ACB9KFJ3_BAUVA|nr:hypothetical protein L6164_035916 [Bauhinia variegata]
MASLSLQASTLPSRSKRVNAAINLPKLPKVSISVPKVPSRSTLLSEELIHRFTDTTPVEKDATSTNKMSHHELNNSSTSKATIQLYAILEAVADRVEMHKNLVDQRDNWNNLLLNSINMITLTASTMAGVAATGGVDVPLFALKLPSTFLFTAATGLLLIMNKIQPSQLAEEQRNATRLFKQLETQIETIIALREPNEEDVKDAMEKVLALDKAYPLPLLGAMLEKFPNKFEPAVWWPSRMKKEKVNKRMEMKQNTNGWNKELEMEFLEVLEVAKRKDIEDYERLGNLVLKVNKSLAIAGPLLTGIAAAGSAFLSQGSWAAIIPVMAGSLAAAINAFEHGGQIGMGFELYRNCGGFFKLFEENIEATLEEKDWERREDGELFEMKVALQLGRSVSQLRELASKSASSRREGIAPDEFASKLF